MTLGTGSEGSAAAAEVAERAAASEPASTNSQPDVVTQQGARRLLVKGGGGASTFDSSRRGPQKDSTSEVYVGYNLQPRDGLLSSVAANFKMTRNVARNNRLVGGALITTKRFAPTECTTRFSQAASTCVSAHVTSTPYGIDAVRSLTHGDPYYCLRLSTCSWGGSHSLLVMCMH